MKSVNFGALILHAIREFRIPSNHKRKMKTDIVQLLDNPYLALGVTIAVIMGYLSVNAIALIWLERKLSARIQRRIGPQRGPFGLMQQIFDMGKLLSKELLTPAHANKLLYVIAPIMVFAPVVALSLALSDYAHVHFSRFQHRRGPHPRDQRHQCGGHLFGRLGIE